MSPRVTQDTKAFKLKLASYKRLIDDDIEQYLNHLEKSTLQQYGASSRIVMDAYISVLKRGGKRIRGALVIAGYEMSGGTNQKMIIQAARAVEMIHAYILIIDDIQDRSALRRGGPSAHKLLEEYYQKNQFGTDTEHFGESLAMNAALLGNHAAQMVLSNLDVDPVLRANALSIMNRTMLVTVHGQTNDILNQVKSDTTQADVDRVMDWKTAYYTVLNPLHMGMVLAGADCHATDAISEYAHLVGRAFQITDDILGTFGTEFGSGKSPQDDIKEGKRTLLAVYALEHAEKADKNFFLQMLGNQGITQSEFNRCKDILVDSGALNYAKTEAKTNIEHAIASLRSEQTRWNAEGVHFLISLAEYIESRTN